MSLDQLNRLAAAAGFVGVPDEQEEVGGAPPARVRFKTPDAPAPRLAAPVATASSMTGLFRDGSEPRTVITQAVSTVLRSAQGLVGARRVTA